MYSYSRLSEEHLTAAYKHTLFRNNWVDSPPSFLVKAILRYNITYESKVLDSFLATAPYTSCTSNETIKIYS